MSGTDHLTEFPKAMGPRDVRAASTHLAEEVAILSPIFSEPFEGRDDCIDVLTQLLGTLDGFKPKLLLREGADSVAVFSASFDGHRIDGADHLHLNDAGLIDGTTVAWRPLAAVAAVQRVLAPKPGRAAFDLVPAGTAS